MEEFIMVYFHLPKVNFSKDKYKGTHEFQIAEVNAELVFGKLQIMLRSLGENGAGI